MTIEEALHAQLIGYAPLAALIGNRALAFAVSEVTTFPSATFQRISTRPYHHRNGYALEAIRYQVDFWSRTYSEALAGRQALRDALDGWQRASAPRVDSSLLQDDRDIKETGSGRYRCSMDYLIFCTES